MKIAVLCDSPLLEKTLKNFLGNNVTPLGSCDFVVSDKKRELHKPVFIIGNDEDADLHKPFSRSSLMLKLEKFYDNGYEEEGSHDIDILKKRITTITDRFLEEIYRELDKFAKR